MEEQLFEAIKYIVNSEMEKTETQKFIKSQIVSGKQLDGSYYIEYQGLQMKAYPSSALSKYAQVSSYMFYCQQVIFQIKNYFFIY